ncbi:hypothetical protein [Hungatella effluvii]|uniref:hypothetical protein n=1 Tax=Hungatella effluvii TaxID=1096246 RepID=UPI0022E731BB|nr:hypothetical protein [Hungatella effluvii]
MNFWVGETQAEEEAKAGNSAGRTTGRWQEEAYRGATAGVLSVGRTKPKAPPE